MWPETCSRGTPMRATPILFSSLFAFLLLAVTGACSPSPDDATSSGPAPAPPAPPPQGESKESKEKPKSDDTEIVVGVDADAFSSFGLNLTEVQITARVDGIVAADETKIGTSTTIFPRELRLAAPKDKLDASVEVDITARMKNDDVVHRKVKTKFVPHQKKLAYVMLEVRCNTLQMAGGFGPSGPTCNAPSTCVGGVCRAPDMNDLPDFANDWATNPPSACGGSASSELAIGVGDKSFTALAENDTVTLERGGQCGHHVWLAFQMANLSQWKTTTSITATQPGSTISVPSTAYPYGWTQTGSGKCELVGVRFQVDVAGNLDEFLGKPLDIVVETTDKAGRKAKVTRHVNVAPTFTNPTGRQCGPGGFNGGAGGGPT
jgi:hypothetical protein